MRVHIRRTQDDRRLTLALVAALFALGAGVSTGGRARAGSPEAPAYSVHNSVRTFAPAGVERTRAGYQFWFFDPTFASGRSVKLSVVGPGQRTHEPHRHEGHEFFFVLEGAAEFFLEGERRRVGPQTALYCPPQSLHGISNAGDTELRYLVIKDYPWPPAERAAGTITSALE